MAKASKPQAPEKIGLSDLKALVAEQTGMSAKEVGDVFTSLREQVAECISEGYKVDVLGIATLDFKHVAAKPKRKGRNPFTGEEMMFKAKSEDLGVNAKPGAAIKKAVPSIRSAAGKSIAAHFTAVRDEREKKAAKKAREEAAAEREAGRGATPPKPKKSGSKKKGR